MHIIKGFFRYTSVAFHRVATFFRPAYDDEVAAFEEEEPLLQPTTRIGDRQHSGASLTSAYEDFAHSKYAVRIFVFHMLMYYIVGLIGLCSLYDHFTWIDALYFLTTVFTTIGYGDCKPHTEAGRVFIIFLALYGIVILGLFLGVAGEAIVQAHNAALHERRAQMRKKVVNELSKEFELFVEHDEDIRSRKHKTLWEEIGEIVWFEAPVIGLLAGVGCIIGHLEGWTIIQSIYWAVVTGTTIGFGDLAPQHEHVRLACCFLMPFMVAALGELLTRIASAYMDRKNHRLEEQFCKRVLTMTDLENLDANHDGEVSEYEFLSYMLVALGKVDQEDIDDIQDLFTKLDVTHSRTLTKNDLCSRRWDRSVRRSMIASTSFHVVVPDVPEMTAATSGEGSKGTPTGEGDEIV